MLAEPLSAAPSARFGYSNGNVQLATAIVEVVTGRSCGEYVRRELWDRVGLADTGFAGDPGTTTIARIQGTLPARLTRVTWGGEGVYSSTSDLYSW